MVEIRFKEKRTDGDDIKMEPFFSKGQRHRGGWENLLNSGGGQNKHYMNLSHVETEFEERTV